MTQNRFQRARRVREPNLIPPSPAWREQMRRGAVAPVLVLALVGGVAACGSSNNSSTPTTVVATGSGKATAFCGYWGTFETSSNNTSSNAQFVQFLKNNGTLISNLTGSVPSGAIGSDAQSLLAGFQVFETSSNPTFTTALMNEGTALDEYCGIEGSGAPLPADFGAGATKDVCKNFLPVYDAVSNAAGSGSGPQVVTAFRNHSTQLNNFGSEISELPSSLQAAGHYVVTVSHQVMSSGNASSVLNGPGQAAAIAYYCGEDN